MGFMTGGQGIPSWSFTGWVGVGEKCLEAPWPSDRRAEPPGDTQGIPLPAATEASRAGASTEPRGGRSPASRYSSLHPPNNAVKWIAAITVSTSQMRNQRQMCRGKCAILGAWDGSVNKTTWRSWSSRGDGAGVTNECSLSVGGDRRCAKGQGSAGSGPGVVGRWQHRVGAGRAP